MFDAETNEAISSLSQEDLLKVSFMIKKLAKKKLPRQQKHKKTEDFTVKKTKNKRVRERVSGENNKNRFLEMQAFHEHKEDTEIDKVLSQTPPTPRNRRTNLVDVTCMNCSSTSEVPPSLIPAERHRYLCNRCQVRGSRT
jgi:hypothetical protein